ncbi:MAG: electron transport complex protein RnfA, partial [Eubacteriales bacterium]
MEQLIDILLLMLSSVLVQNFIFAKFYGICPFLGVSDKPDTALGMGLAVTFVITLSSAATWAVYYLMLEPLGLTYLKTIAFILIIASLVQLIEMFLKKYIPSLYKALG